MKRALVIAGLLALAACSQAPVPPAGSAELSAQKLSTSADDSVIDIAVFRNSGAIYALSESYTSTSETGDYALDTFLSRYRRDGTVVWKRQLGPDNRANANALTTDASGKLYVSYNDRLEKRRSDGSLVWSRAVSYVSALGSDSNGNVYVGGDGGSGTLFLSKYTAAGSRTWTRRIESGGSFFLPTDIATDASGNVYVAANEMDDNFINSYVAKYSPSGTQLWKKRVDGGANDLELTGLEVRGDAFYLSGTSHTNWERSEDSPNRMDGLIIKMSLGGAERWRKVFGTAEADRIEDIATDPSGNVYVTGSTYGRLGGVQPGGSDIFLRKFAANGSTLWTKQIGSAGDDAGNAVVAYSASELYLAGEAGGALRGGTHRGGQDGFLRRTDGDGNRVWTDQ